MKVAVLSRWAVANVFMSGVSLNTVVGAILTGHPRMFFIGGVAFILNIFAAWRMGCEIGPARILSGGFWRTNHATHVLSDAFWADAEARVRAAEGREETP